VAVVAGGSLPSASPRTPLAGTQLARSPLSAAARGPQHAGPKGADRVTVGLVGSATYRRQSLLGAGHICQYIAAGAAIRPESCAPKKAWSYKRDPHMATVIGISTCTMFVPSFVHNVRTENPYIITSFTNLDHTQIGTYRTPHNFTATDV
jgi:hypothetical protein